MKLLGFIVRLHNMRLERVLFAILGTTSFTDLTANQLALPLGIV